jgi:hypothetical protein
VSLGAFVASSSTVQSVSRVEFYYQDHQEGHAWNAGGKQKCFLVEKNAVINSYKLRYYAKDVKDVMLSLMMMNKRVMAIIIVAKIALTVDRLG